MVIIADSGATKTDWLVNFSNKNRIIKTEGINPFHLSEKEISRIIKEELTPQLPTTATHCSAIYFYGAGCLPTHTEGISDKKKTNPNVLQGVNG